MRYEICDAYTAFLLVIIKLIQYNNIDIFFSISAFVKLGFSFKRRNGYNMTNLKNKRKGKKWLSLIYIIVICVLLNILGVKLNDLLGLPLYLDSIGTILAALLGGYIPCITVGFLSNVISGFFNSVSTYYCVISILIAGAAVVYAHNMRRMRIGNILVAILFFALLGGGLGGVLTWLIFGMDFGEGFAVDLAKSINRVIPMGYFLSNMLSTFLIDIVDKFIVAVVALAIYKLLPNSFINNLRNKDWYYISMINKQGKKAAKRFSLRLKVTLLVALSTTFVATSAIAISVLQYHNSTIDEYTKQAEHAGSVIANYMDSGRIFEYMEKGEAADGYLETKELMQTVSDSSPEIKYIYVYRIEKDGTHVIFDLDTKDVPANRPGEVIPYDTTIEKYSELLLKGEEIPMDITNNQYGWILTVYEPVRDAHGKTLCYIGVDMSMEELHSEEISFLAKIISLFIGVLVVIRTYAVWLAERHIVTPVNTIADAANRFSFDTPEARQVSMKELNELDISTGDELENLCNAYRRTTADTIRYIDEVQHKNEQITRLRNGLILVLADMVENRDQCTGDHVRKTAAYCEIILRQMQKEGIYADELTEEFIAEVVNSAPLHDVGKIKISDMILNKPGKLTDEEFRTMQSHTSAGGEIIDKAIATVGEESEYLNEAKNLAEYHHEKWNGEGYPEGLSGEEIPLSARVMAVADVFDALVSRRSYKEPFSIDKALDIIREGSGSHFDPLVVKAFLDAEDEVRRVQKLNMEI